MDSTRLKASFAFCQELTRKKSSSFYHAFWTLPARKRRALFSLYAWLRVLDDLADESGDTDTATRKIEAFYAETLRQIEKPGIATAYDPALAALWPAWTATLEDFQIPHAHLAGVVEGVLWDQKRTRYANFASLQEYCYRVASLVGLMCLHIFGAAIDNRTRELGEKLGLAFQTTNILRDLQVDARLGRIYLPQESLKLFGVNEDDILLGRSTQGLRELLADFAAISDRYYLESLPLMDRVPSHARASLRLMFNSYYRLLELIRERDYQVFNASPIRLNWRDKGRVLWTSVVQGEVLLHA